MNQAEARLEQHRHRRLLEHIGILDSHLRHALNEVARLEQILATGFCARCDVETGYQHDCRLTQERALEDSYAHLKPPGQAGPT